MSVIQTIKSRKSPYAFNGKSVSFENVRTAFEAAQWAASAYNSQPWRFIFAERGTPEFETLKNFAIPFNQNWLEHAGAIAAICARTISEAKGEPDPSAIYCTGLAVGQFSVELTALGIDMHQLSAFDADAMRTELQLPDYLTPVAMMGLGYGEVNDATPADLAEMEAGRKERTRKPLEEIVIGVGEQFKS